MGCQVWLGAGVGGQQEADQRGRVTCEAEQRVGDARPSDDASRAQACLPYSACVLFTYD